MSEATRIATRIFCVRIFLALLTSLGVGGLVDCRAQPPENPVAQFEEFFQSFAEQAGPLAPMFGKFSPEQMERLESVDITVAEENKFGQRVLDAYREQLGSGQIALSTKGKDVDYLQMLCNGLKASMKNGKRYRHIDIRIIEVESTDAYSIPGGHLLVTRGLLETCGSEAALVGTLAHELSHLDRGHQLLQLKQSKLAQQPLNFKDGMMLISTIARPFRPEQETEADRDATEWMMSAGYAASELARLLNSWDQRQTREMPWMAYMPSMIKSHPNPGRRAQDVLVLAEKLQPQYPDAKFVGVENLEQRVPKIKPGRR